MQSTSADTSLGLAVGDAARPPGTLWLASAALAASATWLIYGALPGINWLLITLGLAAAVLALERPGRASLRPRRYQALALMVILAGAEAVTADAANQFLLLVGILWLAAVATCLASGFAPERLGPTRLAGAGFVAPLIIAREGAAVFGSGVRALGNEASVPLLRGTLLATLVVAIFIALLGQADPTLGTLRDSFVELLSSLTGLWRVLFFVVVGFGLLGFLHLALPSAVRADAAAVGEERRDHTDTERLIVLGAVAAVFAVFLLLQLTYLFGNPGARVGSGVTLAEAVHRGFGEMTVVVALTALIIVGLERAAVRGPRERLVNGITFLVLAECLVLLASAYYRVTVYEAAYGYTIFRLYVRLYVAFLTVVTFLLAGELVRGLAIARLCWRAAVTALVALAVLGYWNYPAWIVRANVERFTQRGQIDVGYLEHLGSDALPELVQLLPRLSPADRADVLKYLNTGRMAPAASAEPAEAWFEWNLRRSAARAARREVIDNGS